MNRNRVLASVAVVATMGLIAPSAHAVTSKPTAAQKATLQYLVEEEKLARDVYTYLASKVTTQKFSNIARSEQTHMDEISALLKTYKVYNPTTTRKPGVFKNTELQALYNQLTTEGSAGLVAAFGAGITIETMDIADLEKILLDDMPADMKLAVNRLLNGSKNHLAAFNR